MTRLDTLIVGGGLAGLSLAAGLLGRAGDAGSRYHLLEARDRFGGRILSHHAAHGADRAAFDLGPAWLWPGQPRIRSLLESLDLRVFEQYAAGELLYQDERGRVQRGRGYASMAGALRVDGGLGAVIAKLAERVGQNASLGRPVSKLTYTGEYILTDVRSPRGTVETIESDRVVLAVPPRVAARTIEFGSGISAEAVRAMQGVPTWMAGHAKALAIYDRPFWREAGLSGDAMSRRGPLVEVHDASPRAGGPFALFGFFGIDAGTRHRHRELVTELVAEQLVALFGEFARNPLELVVKDWAFENETATELDRVPARTHPHDLPLAMRTLWDGRLIFGSTEVAAEFGGYLEGALASAEDVARRLLEGAQIDA